MGLFIHTLFVIHNRMRSLLLLTLLLNLSVAIAQKKPPAIAQVSDPFLITALPSDGVLLNKNWKWQAGDNPQWAKPAFDDRRWQAIDPTKDIMELPQLHLTTVGWLRLQFSFADSLTSQLALMIWQSGASELYLDGTLIHHVGKLSGDLRTVKALNPEGKPVSFPISPATNHVLAVRYALQPGLSYATTFGYQNRGFKAILNTLEGANDQYSQSKSFVAHGIRIGVFFILGILALAIYLFYPVQKANLYFFAYTFLQEIVWLIFRYTDNHYEVEPQYLLRNISVNAYEIGHFLMLWAIYILLAEPKGWSFKSLLVLGIFSALISAFMYGWGWLIYAQLYTNLINIDITRMAFKSVRNGRKGAWILAGGSIGFLVFWALFSLQWSGYLTSLIPGVSFDISQLSIPLAVALYMAYEFALTHRSLQQQLIEVKRLSAEKQQLLTTQNETLEAQLTQRTQEIEQQSRLLEAQHIRQLETEFEQKLADTEMTALRAQMNPHFIFNCLNSIKLYTLDNEADKASDYLTKFSRLIRLVLENSRSEMVPLQNELEALRLYLELEAMRFKQKVQFSIHVAPTIDQRFLCIPPLLLQPYVENAIWHGLMHKFDGGTVTVAVSQPQDNLLYIEITDDGVGRERARELKSKSADRHKSFGMQVTADRIRMINQLYNIQTQAQVVDLVDSFGDPCGTKVMLTIPV